MQKKYLLPSITIAIFIACTTIITNAQTDKRSQLIGKWLLHGDYDCPDLIELNKNGFYIIYNDCGAEDPRLPVVEIGNWVLKNNEVVFSHRDIKNEHSDFAKYHGKDDELILKLREVSESKLIFSFKNPTGKFITECYKKVPCE